MQRYSHIMPVAVILAAILAVLGGILQPSWLYKSNCMFHQFYHEKWILSSPKPIPRHQNHYNIPSSYKIQPLNTIGGHLGSHYDTHLGYVKRMLNSYIIFNVINEFLGQKTYAKTSRSFWYPKRFQIIAI